MRLGWRWTRPNDFQSPDKRPLRDTFSNLQKHMQWPHAGVTLSGAIGNAVFGAATLTAVNAPLAYNEYDLVRNNVIQVPFDFAHYLAVGVAGGLMDNVGAGSYVIGIRHNGTTGPFMSSEHTALATDVRACVAVQFPCERGDNFEVVGSAPAAGSTWLSGSFYIYFLPLA